MIDPEFDELKREFLIEADQKIREIRESFGGSKSPTSEAIERAIYLAHQLKGAGGSYGFQTISTDAAALERALEKMAHGDSEVLNDINSRVESLVSIVERRSRELAPAARNA